MPQQKRGLGKGLGALIPTGPIGQPPASLPGYRADAAAASAAAQLAEVGGAYFDEIPIDAIAPNPRQPR